MVEVKPNSEVLENLTPFLEEGILNDPDIRKKFDFPKGAEFGDWEEFGDEDLKYFKIDEVKYICDKYLKGRCFGIENPHKKGEYRGYFIDILLFMEKLYKSLIYLDGILPENLEDFKDRLDPLRGKKIESIDEIEEKNRNAVVSVLLGFTKKYEDGSSAIDIEELRQSEDGKELIEKLKNNKIFFGDSLKLKIINLLKNQLIVGVFDSLEKKEKKFNEDIVKSIKKYKENPLIDFPVKMKLRIYDFILIEIGLDRKDLKKWSLEKLLSQYLILTRYPDKAFIREMKFRLNDKRVIKGYKICEADKRRQIKARAVEILESLGDSKTYSKLDFPDYFLNSGLVNLRGTFEEKLQKILGDEYSYLLKDKIFLTESMKKRIKYLRVILRILSEKKFYMKADFPIDVKSFIEHYQNKVDESKRNEVRGFKENLEKFLRDEFEAGRSPRSSDEILKGKSFKPKK